MRASRALPPLLFYTLLACAATWPLEDRLAHDAFKPGDLLADGGLGQAQEVGCADEGTLLGYRTQGHQVSEIQASQGNHDRRLAIHKQNRSTLLFFIIFHYESSPLT